MIRLSESMARMHCQDEVKQKHVNEAFRLLNKSIIRVETPDIQFEEDEEEVHMEEDNQEEQPAGMVNGNLANGHQEEEDTTGQAKKPSLRLSYEEYRRLANLIVLFLRGEEGKQSEDEVSLRKSDVVNWYLKEIEEDIETEQQLEEKKFLIDKVLGRLIHHDHVLLALKDAGSSEKKSGEEEDEDPFLVVHPNFVVE